MTLRAGFEPARGDPIGFQVQRLNHSAIAADEPHNCYENKSFRYFLYNGYIAKFCKV